MAVKGKNFVCLLLPLSKIQQNRVAEGRHTRGEVKLCKLCVDTLVYEQSTNHLLKKNRPRCFVKSPTAQDVFRPIPVCIMAYLQCCGDYLLNRVEVPFPQKLCVWSHREQLVCRDTTDQVGHLGKKLIYPRVEVKIRGQRSIALLYSRKLLSAFCL